MVDLFQAPGLPGYRLHKLEMLNWGTFDSQDGTVHRLAPRGKTCLLVGLNGSGKSTAVDALLTLLVKSGIRNYNVAAGGTGGKRERNEISYILGAYDHGSQESGNQAKTLYLRKEGKHISVLLAYFHNEDLDKGFTLAQVLYLNSDRRAEKIYCVSPGERGIEEDFKDISAWDKVRKQLKDRGFQIPGTFTDYAKWLARETRMKERAMDVFNQTVSVKDIRSLNDFIRDHMLDPPDWQGDRIREVLTHFEKLSEAYAVLVKARRQLETLQPVAESGEQYRALSAKLESRQQLLKASELFFRDQISQVLSARREKWEDEKLSVENRLVAVEDQKRDTEKRIRKLENDIENAGDARLRELPALIEKHTILLETRKVTASRFHHALRQAEIDTRVSSEPTFQSVREQLTQLDRTLGPQADEAGENRAQRAHRRLLAEQERDELGREIQALAQRHTNLPRSAEELRAALCRDLQIPLGVLPFAAELMAVKSSERVWESAVEMVLRKLGLSLLVPADQYAAVSKYVNATRLRNSEGRGQRLGYYKIGAESGWELAKREPGPRSLWHKLEFKADHPLAGWLQSELAAKFDILCCENVEEFQMAPPPALTAQRQLKFKGERHEKDDRDGMDDPRNYVLGWDNQAKLALLRQDYRARADLIKELEEEIAQLQARERKLRARHDAVRDALKVSSFQDLDTASEESILAQLTEEKERLEKSDQRILAFKEELKEAERQKSELERKQKELDRQVALLERDIEQASKAILAADRIVFPAKEEGRFAEAEVHFETLREELTARGMMPFDESNILSAESAYQSSAHAEIRSLEASLKPLQEKVQDAMHRFLHEFPEYESELRVRAESVDDFLAIRERLLSEDLPQHEKRFRDFLTDKVVTEIGVFQTLLSNESERIKDKIEQLNKCLGTIDYNSSPRTVMRLEPRLSRDKEIVGFQQQLRSGLDGAYDGTAEALEACYRRIEEIIARLKTEERWKEKVTDVRNWYDFVARESDAATGEERGYYTDSQGQSGGEKAKLAFTILVAAVVYQFDLNVDAPSSDRFQFVMVDEMFSKVDDRYATYAMRLFAKFGLQLLIVAPFDSKAKVTEPFVERYLLVTKTDHHSQVLSMTAKEFRDREKALLG